MYEGKRGAKRLICTLERYVEDVNAVKKIAYALNYDEQQLRDDIKALSECMLELTRTKSECGV